MSVISVTTSGGTRRGPGGRIQHYASGVGWVESTVLGRCPVMAVAAPSSGCVPAIVSCSSRVARPIVAVSSHEGQGAHDQLRVRGHSDRPRPDEGVDEPGPAPCPGRAAQPMERAPRGRPPVSRDQRADSPTALVTECCGAPRLRRTWACVHEWDAFREGRVTCASERIKPEHRSDAVTARRSVRRPSSPTSACGTWRTTPATSSGRGVTRPTPAPIRDADVTGSAVSRKAAAELVVCLEACRRSPWLNARHPTLPVHQRSSGPSKPRPDGAESMKPGDALAHPW